MWGWLIPAVINAGIGLFNANADREQQQQQYNQNTLLQQKLSKKQAIQSIFDQYARKIYEQQMSQRQGMNPFQSTMPIPRGGNFYGQ